MLGRLLCWLGIHKFVLRNEKTVGKLTSKECKRCKAHYYRDVCGIWTRL
ncbi:unnamed protein product [marine sediment metagenome]|uniref:Uncharacterized protein n=1 Tax=marine sediment metagenome TaxID=412755 RepID=X0WPD5_9ZZZZ